MDFEFLDHDEALSVFRSPRPSDTLDELQKLAVRERIMKETGDYPLGYPFRFETPNTFSAEDLRNPFTDGYFPHSRFSRSLLGVPLHDNPFMDPSASVLPYHNLYLVSFNGDPSEDTPYMDPLSSDPLDNNPWLQED